MPHMTQLEVYKQDIPLNDYYLIGVDTASSVNGCYSAIEIFSYKDFEQIAELKVRLGSLTKYGDIVDKTFKWLYKLVGSRIILCVENNSIGKSIIEHLTEHVTDFNYLPFLYKEKDRKDYGINTNNKTKDLMISFLYELITETPSCVKSNELIGQLHTIERTNGGIVSSRSFSDMFMAACMAAYGRKMTLLDIMPKLTFSNAQLENQLKEHVKLISTLANPRMDFENNSNIITPDQDYKLSYPDEEKEDLPFYFGVL